MATYEYLSPLAALARFGEQPAHREWQSIRGCRMVFADWCTRTQGGQSRVPQGPANEHAHKGFKYVDRIERVTVDADPGTVEIFYVDGTRTYATGQDLVCVEQEIMPVHYGESRSACGEFGKFDKMTDHIPGVTCKKCVKAVNAAV